MENIKLEIVKEKKKRGRPKKNIVPEVPLEEPIPLSSVPTVEESTPIKKRGRPRKNVEASTIPIVKRSRGRPKKFVAELNIEIPASKYNKQGFNKQSLSEMDKINMTESTQNILERAHKTGFQIVDLTKESPSFIANIPRGTFIKYITTMNQFRIGGILRQVDDKLRYFSLYNPKMKSSWSVQIPNIKYLMFKSKKNVDSNDD